MDIYVVGILKNAQITECTMATFTQSDANAEARRTHKNVYQVKEGKFYLRKIFAVRPALLTKLGPLHRT